MTKKRRKTLDDALAQQFVYGEEIAPEEPVPKEEPPPVEDKSIPPTLEQPSNEGSLMDKLQLEPKEVTKRFTVDLPETMHRKLSILSAKTSRTKADIVRMLLEDVLKDVGD